MDLVHKSTSHFLLSVDRIQIGEGNPMSRSLVQAMLSNVERFDFVKGYLPLKLYLDVVAFCREVIVTHQFLNTLSLHTESVAFFLIISLATITHYLIDLYGNLKEKWTISYIISN